MAQGQLFIPSPAEKKRVATLAGYGVPIDQIAALIQRRNTKTNKLEGINPSTLVKYFKKELKTGKAKANAKIGKTLFQRAVEGDTSAAIWWSKSQMGWKAAADDNSKEKEASAPPITINLPPEAFANNPLYSKEDDERK